MSQILLLFQSIHLKNQIRVSPSTQNAFLRVGDLGMIWIRGLIEIRIFRFIGINCA